MYIIYEYSKYVFILCIDIKCTFTSMAVNGVTSFDM